MLPPGSQPVEFEIQRGSHLRIRWSDGQETVTTLRDLRRACPCAACRAARSEAEEQRGSLPVLRPAADESAMTTVSEAHIVGRYAIKIRWQDGHDAGIFDFGLLRTLGN